MDTYNFKVDTWWKALLLVGAAFIAVSLTFEIEIVDRRHLLGLGIGMSIIGFSNWIAIKTVVHRYGPSVFYGPVPIHNAFTNIMQAIGIILSVLFVSLIVWELI